MSKNDAPAATSFLEPSKTGWLTKHGGSGIKSSWKKRWFVLDHHYMFYYETTKDKHAKGIICLPDYKNCRRTEKQECAKKHSLILIPDPHLAEPGSTPRTYYIHSESEEEIDDWVEAIMEEMQPTIGVRKRPETRSKSLPEHSKHKAGSTPKMKIKTLETKDLDAVAVVANDGPQLVHLTKGRPAGPPRKRPPRRYKPVDEDDDVPATKDSAVSPVSSPKLAKVPPNKMDASSPAAAKKEPQLASTIGATDTPPSSPSPINVKKPMLPSMSKQNIKPLQQSPVIAAKGPPVPPPKPMKEDEVDTVTTSPSMDLATTTAAAVQPSIPVDAAALKESPNKSPMETTFALAPQPTNRLPPLITKPKPPLLRPKPKINITENSAAPKSGTEVTVVEENSVKTASPLEAGAVSRPLPKPRSLTKLPADAGEDKTVEKVDGATIATDATLQTDKKDDAVEKRFAADDKNAVPAEVGKENSRLTQLSPGGDVQVKEVTKQDEEPQNSETTIENASTSEDTDEKERVTPVITSDDDGLYSVVSLIKKSPSEPAEQSTTPPKYHEYDFVPLKKTPTPERTLETPEYDYIDDNLVPNKEPLSAQDSTYDNWKLKRKPEKSPDPPQSPLTDQPFIITSDDSSDYATIESTHAHDVVESSSPPPVETPTSGEKALCVAATAVPQYAKLHKKSKKKSNKESELPAVETDEDAFDALFDHLDASIPSHLNQAKEILRLAHMVKHEAVQLKVEAAEDREAARKERMDAELAKKNALEILRMAKEKAVLS